MSINIGLTITNFVRWSLPIGNGKRYNESVRPLETEIFLKNSVGKKTLANLDLGKVVVLALVVFFCI